MKLSDPDGVLPPVSAGAPDGEADAARFEQFVRAYQHLVFATAVRLLGRGMEAEDVAQDVFLKAFERFDMLAENPAAPGWLRTVTRNACLNLLTRQRSRWRLFSELGHDRDETIETLAGGREDEALVQLIQGTQPDADVVLEAALRRLPDAQRVPLVLFHFEGLSYQEIAETLGVSLGKIKTDIHRGREALKRYVTDGTR